MAGKAPFPSRQEILDFIRDSDSPVGKREIARAFHIRGDDRIALKQVLKGLQKEGLLDRHQGRRLSEVGRLPNVMMVEVTGPDPDGELMARPAGHVGDEPPPPIYLLLEQKGPAPAVGDRLLARLRAQRDGSYLARIIKNVGAGRRERVLGVLETARDGLRLRPVDRRQRGEFLVTEPGEARAGELVAAEVSGGRRLGLPQARVVERLADTNAPKAISLIAIAANDIPVDFPDEALAQAEAAGAAPVEGRVDLRQLPLVTIDGADARDFDDAVWAEADGDGWHAVVAIADVAWYVRPGDALDHAAFERGNSVYFPDRVVPMLPEALSNGWCSLRPDEERPCLAVHMRFDAEGRKTDHHFVRAVMRSAARLTYDQVEAAHHGQPDETTGPLLDPVIKPLYGVYRALRTARERRGALDIDSTERKVDLDELGRVRAIRPRPRLDSHQVIEELMIAANVCAAETLEHHRQPCMYRIHDEPAQDKVAAVREFLAGLGLKLPKGQVLKPGQFNAILAKARGQPWAPLVNELVLRCQMQAQYNPDNHGHFGLALRRYAHFTSPIRRYADLLVHRALIRALDAGPGSLPDGAGDAFHRIGEHISITERRASQAEREANDRYVAAYLGDRIGEDFSGRIMGVTRFGLFVRLDETAADGLVPVASLPDDFYDHDEQTHRLVGRRFGRTYTLGERVTVRLLEADKITGSVVLRLLTGGKVSKEPATRRAKAPRRPRSAKRR